MRRDVLILIALALFAAVMHGVNMFDYPAVSLADDEGTYLEQAWSVLREGRLAPYTYTYDHVPGGWVQIAGWFALVGPRAFGSVLATGRVFILILHVASVALLYLSARRLGVPRAGSIIGGALFAASPLALFYGREVILENVMVFWLMVSLALLLFVRGATGAALSGLALGIAILSKEPALILVPAYAFLAATRAPRHTRTRDVVSLVAPALMVAAIYPLYALSQGQLWPSATLVTKSTDPRAYAGSSLIDSLLWQLRRPGGNPFDAASEVRVAIGDWLRRDAILIVGGLAASVRNVLRDRRRSSFAPLGVLGVLAFLFLVRGGIVYPFHVVLAIPFLALNLGIVAAELLPRISLPRAAILAPVAHSRAYRPVAAMIAMFVFWSVSGALPALYLEHPGVAAQRAVRWIEATVPEDSVVVGRDDLWAELHEPDVAGHTFAAYHTHWRLSYDEAARNAVLTSGWRSIAYIVVTQSLVDGVQTTHDGELGEALRNGELVERWIVPTSDQALHAAQVIEVWQVDPSGSIARLRAVCEEMRSMECPEVSTGAIR
ncbi:MAG TPA: glycosyltransferase family 39 protein [Candidatus Limnocylindrales bacterium]|nr:glycosyltransferase family 39 protein [Candidatus Limnocylindrales bacterium]